MHTSSISWVKVALLATVAHVALPVDIHAGDPAEAHLRKGVQLLARDRNEEALLEFRRAYALSRTPRAAAQVAFAERALMHWVSAEAFLEEALAALDDPWIQRNRAILSSELAEVQKHVAALEISGGTPGAEVRVNAAAVGILPLRKPLRVAEGRTTIVVGTGPQEHRQIIDLEGGDRKTVSFAAPEVQGHGALPLPPVRVPPAIVAPSPPPSVVIASARADDQFWLDMAPWVALAGGATSMTLGFVLVNRDCGASATPTCRENKPALYMGLTNVATGIVALLGAEVRWLSRGRGPTGKTLLTVGSIVNGLALGFSSYLLISQDGYSHRSATEGLLASVGMGMATLSLLSGIGLAFENDPAPGEGMRSSIVLVPLPGGAGVGGRF
jgi:hypothetical protein